jgi:hypothetical protein
VKSVARICGIKKRVLKREIKKQTNSKNYQKFRDIILLQGRFKQNKINSKIHRQVVDWMKLEVKILEKVQTSFPCK